MDDTFDRELNAIDAINFGVNSKNILTLIEDNIKKKLGESRPERIKKEIEELDQALIRAYVQDGWTYHFVIVELPAEKEEDISQYYTPETITTFRKKTDLRCVLVRTVDAWFHIFDPQLEFVITNLKNDKILCKEMKQCLNLFSAEVVKEYV